MDANTIAALISSVGFPIVSAGALFWYMVTEERKTREVIENNTHVIFKILEHIRNLDYEEVENE